MSKRRLHPVGNAQRLRILKRDNYICQYCFEGATEVDHIIPYSYIPCNSDENLVASCGECNRLASNMVFPGFLEKYMYIKRKRQQRGNLQRHSPVVMVRAIIDEVPRPTKKKTIKPAKPRVVKPPKAKPKDTYDPSDLIKTLKPKSRTKRIRYPDTVSREFRAMMDELNAEMDARLHIPPEMREILNRFRKPVRDDDQ